MNPEAARKLKLTRLFREFTDDEITALLELTEPMEVEAREAIVRQDDKSDSMFVIVEGQARVIHHKDGRQFELAVLQEGDFFGELGLVDEGPRSADVIAEQPCTLLRIEQSAISALAGVFPKAAFKLLIAVGRVLVERMRASNRRYIDSLLIASGGKD